MPAELCLKGSVAMEDFILAAKAKGYVFEATEKVPGNLYVSVLLNGRVIGDLHCGVGTRLVLTNAQVYSPEHQRKGLGTAMAQFAKRQKPELKMGVIPNIIPGGGGRELLDRLERLGIIDIIDQP
jgi:hypothetical protein